MDLADYIDRNAAFTPEKVAIRFARSALSYAELAQQIAATARGLAALGIGPGDRIAVLAANHPAYLVLLYACARLGAMLVPINWRLAVPEQLYILADAAVKALLLEESHAAVLESLGATVPAMRSIGLDFTPAGGTTFAALQQAGGKPPSGGDLSRPLLIVYTSGTTGQPKGAVLRQDALIWNAVMSQHMHDMTAQDHVLTVLPMFHVGGLNIQTTPALQLGATVTLHARFSPEATLAAIAGDAPTLTVLVPTTIQALIAHPDWQHTPLDSLRAVTTGSTQVPQGLVDAFVSRGIPVLQVYGATETCPLAVYTRLSGDWRRAGSTGLPGLVCEAKLVDDAGQEVAVGAPGEVIVRGPNVFTHYHGNAAASGAALREGWYYSGDIGTRDGDGHFFIHERKKNVIISGGENIYPAEVERVLALHPAIAAAAVISRADERWQEVPVACLVLRPGLAAEPGELEAFCSARLARYKVPKAYVFLETLPLNALGKVQHFRLKELITEGAAPGSRDAGAKRERAADEDRRPRRWQWRVRGGR
jgi:fatty-acyl-CoA synthase